MPAYIDTHCHLDSIMEKLSLSEYSALASAHFTRDLEGCVHVACAPGSLERGRTLLAQDRVWGAFGIHPHDAGHYNDAVEQAIEAALREEPKAVAWGEIGLDYHYDFSDRPTQRSVFERQLDRAVLSGKPVVIHTREAEEDTLAILRDRLPGDRALHVHCFTGSEKMAAEILEHFSQACIGFTGAITFKTADALRDVVRLVPLDRILLETDGPYLAPVPHRGKPAHPGMIPFIANKIAEVKAIEVDEVFQTVRRNTSRIYGI